MSLKSDQVTLLASATQTAAGNSSSSFDLSSYEAGVVFVSLTAATALTALSVFLQATTDGTNWYGAAAGVAGGVPFFGGITLAAFTAPQLLAFPAGRSIAPTVTSAVPMLTSRMRIAWTMTGTNATFAVTGQFYHE
jgi:hypothetical protein